MIHNIGNPVSEVVDMTSFEDNEEEAQGNQSSEVEDGIDAGLLDI